jgi:hypothetical protein
MSSNFRAFFWFFFGGAGTPAQRIDRSSERSRSRDQGSDCPICYRGTYGYTSSLHIPTSPPTIPKIPLHQLIKVEKE